MSKAVISSLQLPMDAYESITDWAQAMENWVKQAKADGAALVLFPEYGSLSLGSLLPEADRAVADDMMRAMQQFLPEFHSTFKTLAQRYDLIIVTSSFPCSSKMMPFTTALLSIHPRACKAIRTS